MCTIFRVQVLDMIQDRDVKLVRKFNSPDFNNNPKGRKIVSGTEDYQQSNFFSVNFQFPKTKRTNSWEDFR